MNIKAQMPKESVMYWSVLVLACSLCIAGGLAADTGITLDCHTVSSGGQVDLGGTDQLAGVGVVGLTQAASTNFELAAVGFVCCQMRCYSICGDFDCDFDVDLDDYVVLEAAMNGPGQAPGDDVSDLDNDNDCDLADFEIFAANFTGAF